MKLGRGIATIAIICLVTPSTPAWASRRPRCAGQVATIVGTNKSDLLKGTGTSVIVARGGADRILALETDVVCAGRGNDSVEGSGTYVHAGPGNDEVQMQGGFYDYLHYWILEDSGTAIGGAGNDTLNAGVGSAMLIGGTGEDQLLGGSDGDTLIPGPGDDVVSGGPSPTLEPPSTDHVFYSKETEGVSVNQNPAGGTFDWVSEVERYTGSPFDDYIVGTTANETFYGGTGSDVINALSGNDFISDVDDQGTLNGGSGSDTASFALATTGVKVSLLEQIREASTELPLIDIENIFGSPYDDVLLGDERDNRLSGGGGQDQIEGREGDDELSWGASVDGGDGRDLLSLDSLTEGISADLVTGTMTGKVTGITTNVVSIEDFTGSDFNDTIAGTSGAETIRGQGGNDSIFGQGGFDLLFGGWGDDNIESGNEAVLIRGEGGQDTLVSGTGDDDVTGGIGNDSISGGPGADTLSGGGTMTMAEAGVSTCRDRDFIFSVQVNDGTDVVRAGPGDDVIWGGIAISDAGYCPLTLTDLGDDLNGEAGNDSLYGQGGDDIIEGGSGKDVADGGEGSDSCVAETQKDCD